MYNELVNIKRLEHCLVRNKGMIYLSLIIDVNQEEKKEWEKGENRNRKDQGLVIHINTIYSIKGLKITGVYMGKCDGRWVLKIINFRTSINFICIFRICQHRMKSLFF